MPGDEYALGMVGLGVMGRNLALNMADHGYSVAGYDTDTERIKQFNEAGEGSAIHGFGTMAELIASLSTPKIVMMLVPAGKPVDSVIEAVLPHLSEKDILIDGGNSHYTDTDRRARDLEKKGVYYLGVGVSGGAHGARYGPSIMPGGPRHAYEQVRQLLEAVAAHVDDTPCVTWLGPGSAGHYVKMVHNGIEYGLMELIAETYDLLSQGLGLSCVQLADIYSRWNDGPLNSYLIEITADVFRKIDDDTHKPLVEVILDEAQQKGTGTWASESALDLQVAVPMIDTAVQMRFLSTDRAIRRQEAHVLKGPLQRYEGDADSLMDDLEKAMHAGAVITYAQGFFLLGKASAAMAYDFDYEKIAAIWRGGCIVRSALLEDIMQAFQHDAGLAHLLEDPDLSELVVGLQPALRSVVQAAAATGIPAPGMMSILSYYDALRSSWLPANLIQAQRDYFGSHRYQRVDKEGSFHTQWSSAES